MRMSSSSITAAPARFAILTSFTVEIVTGYSCYNKRTSEQAICCGSVFDMADKEEPAILQVMCLAEAVVVAGMRARTRV